MSMSKRTFRTQQAIAAFEDCLKCATLPENKKGDVQGELSRAQSRLAQQEAEVYSKLSSTDDSNKTLI